MSEETNRASGRDNQKQVNQGSHRGTSNIISQDLNGGRENQRQGNEGNPRGTSNKNRANRAIKEAIEEHPTLSAGKSRKS